jgi:Cu-processing system permease protein
VNAVFVLARWDVRALLRDRWFVSIAAAFALLVIAAAGVALSSANVLGVSSFDRAAATLIHLTMIFAPLIGLTVGATWLAGERESGALAMLLSQPVHRDQVYDGTALGLAWAVSAATMIGFGAAGAVLSLRATTERAAPFLAILALSLLLAVATLAIGLWLSSAAQNRSRALGGALVVWLLLVIVSDLGLLGTAAMLRLPAPAVLLLGSLNPVSAFRIASIVVISGSAELTGPVGLYGAQRLGTAGLVGAMTASLLGWTAAAYFTGRWRFRRSVEG